MNHEDEQRHHHHHRQRVGKRWPTFQVDGPLELHQIVPPVAFVPFDVSLIAASSFHHLLLFLLSQERWPQMQNTAVGQVHDTLVAVADDVAVLAGEDAPSRTGPV